jgi:hypothetical protein
VTVSPRAERAGQLVPGAVAGASITAIATTAVGASAASMLALRWMWSRARWRGGPELRALEDILSARVDLEQLGGRIARTRPSGRAGEDGELPRTAPGPAGGERGSARGGDDPDPAWTTHEAVARLALFGRATPGRRRRGSRRGLLLQVRRERSSADALSGRRSSNMSTLKLSA